MKNVLTNVQEFIKLESSAGMILAASAFAALVFKNSFLAATYAALLDTPMVIAIGDFEIAKPLVLWINDGLMAVFFFLIGLEVKREVLEGELSSLDKASLPIFAAIGGMVFPALFFCLFAFGDPEAMRGWAIPAATDIAFALAVLALLGDRAPASLKILLLAIAIIDDLGAIVIIALFYTADLSAGSLLFGLAGVAALVCLNRMGIKNITPYILVGVLVWVFVLKSGVHATLAGVVTALTIPIEGRTADDQSPLHAAEKNLHKWVAFLILPVFAFANAGVSFSGASFSSIFAPLPAGIIAGLVIGKPLGVLLMSFLSVRMNFSTLPAELEWRHIAGAGCLTGIGFTMSLFIGGLAFNGPAEINAIRMGVLLGSLVAGGLGAFILINPRGIADKLFAPMKAKEMGPRLVEIEE
ncbi:MAG: Na+/H+ antiporter NhaA [Pseudomonadota bacterium]